jgi:SEC-C motif-containing protein
MSKTIGRNDPCPCGSGKKYKKCHIDKAPVDPMSPDFQAKAWALFDSKTSAEKQRKEQFGEVLPIIHTEAFGKRLVGAGNAIYSVDPKASFEDFLRDYLRETLGPDWWKGEMAKPVLGRHQIAQWQAHAEELMRGEAPDERGRYSIPRDGVMTAYLTLAYDLHTIRQNIAFQERIVERLRQRDGFTGFRYELLVAATFVRAGFRVKPEDETDGRKRHPEFIATHKQTGFAVAVEAKARNRRRTDRNPARVGVDDLIADAATKAPKDMPYVVFVDVAMPPGERDQPPTWGDEVDQAVKAVIDKHGGAPGPFDWVFFTNIPHQFGSAGEPDPPRHWLGWQPRVTRITPDIQEAIVTAVHQYGRIPEFETRS